MYGCMSRGGLDRLWVVVVVDSVGGALLDSGTRIPQQPLVGCCNSSRQGNAHQCNRVLHTAPTVGAWKRPPQQQQAGGACETIIALSPPHLDVAACDHHGSGTTRCTRGGAGRQGRAHDAGAQSPAHARLPVGGHSGLMAVPAGAVRACVLAGRQAGALVRAAVRGAVHHAALGWARYLHIWSAGAAASTYRHVLASPP